MQTKGIMVYYSCLQTVEVVFPNSTNRFLTLKYAPPRLVGPQDCLMYDYDPHDKKTTYWYPDQTIRIFYETGKVETYHPKPTIQDVFRENRLGQYFRQHSDGSVEHGWDGVYYYWGRDDEVEWSFYNGPWYFPRAKCPCEGCEEWRSKFNFEEDYDGRTSYSDYGYPCDSGYD